jgi:cobalt-zinc-cadmium efflux system membrane fusion protein
MSAQIAIFDNVEKVRAQRHGAALFGLALLCSGLLGCGRQPDMSVQPSPLVFAQGKTLRIPDDSPLRSHIVVEPVQRKDLPRQIVAPAVVEADPSKTVAILPPLTGRIVTLDVGLGDHVKKGQVLMVIASGDLAQAYADADKARDALDLATKALARAKEVKDSGGVAGKDLESFQSQHNQAQAESERANTRLQSLGGEVDRSGGARQLVVKAPTGGSVTTLSVAPGGYINDVTSPAMTIANLDSVWITANIAENDLGRIAKGQTVDVTLPAYPADTFHGTVRFVDAVLASDTRRARARIVFQNLDSRLKPNMYANAAFLVPEPPQVFLPQSALLMNNDNTTIFVEVAPWIFERRTVIVGADEGALTRILSGVSPGERAVIQGGVLLND